MQPSCLMGEMASRWLKFRSARDSRHIRKKRLLPEKRIAGQRFFSCDSKPPVPGRDHVPPASALESQLKPDSVQTTIPMERSPQETMGSSEGAGPRVAPGQPDAHRSLLGEETPPLFPDVRFVNSGLASLPRLLQLRELLARGDVDVVAPEPAEPVRAEVETPTVEGQHRAKVIGRAVDDGTIHGG